MSITETVVQVLGPGGRLASSWPGFEFRQGQVDMAAEVARAFELPDVALVEAGTGTGKTLAYIIPSLLSHAKTVVSTGTKNLQDQIFYKDIPFIKKALGSGFRAAYLKGRDNYLCPYFFQAFLREPTFAAVHEAVFLDRLKKWAEETATGDRAELTDFPEQFMTWSDISASADRCLRRKCPDFEQCFLEKARRTAAAADLVVVNHHLFMADLSVREGGYGEVIPDHEAVIFDEAHQIEDVATQHFGLVVSTWQLGRLRRDTETILGKAKKMRPDIGRDLAALYHFADTLSKNFFLKATEFELWTGGEEMDRLHDLLQQTLNLLAGLAGKIDMVSGDDEEILALHRRMKAAIEALGIILEAAGSRYVYWSERRNKALFFHASPIDVAPFMQERLYSRNQPLVFTSATLTARRTFDFFKQRMGLMPEVEGIIVDSPFNLQKQALLYIPQRFPMPMNQDYLPALVEEIERLLACSRGRAFVLFTSYRNLNYVAETLGPRLPWPLLVQGHAPRNALLDRFRKETASVLMATQSFWQGVDVPGESLSAVIIDKLPFPRPDRPLVKSRSRRLQEEGYSPFTHYSVPEAIIQFKQGLGRLIRNTSDRGLLAVLDVRLIRKGYGRYFFESLPPVRLTHDLAEVDMFFKTDNEKNPTIVRRRR